MTFAFAFYPCSSKFTSANTLEDAFMTVRSFDGYLEEDNRSITRQELLIKKIYEQRDRDTHDREIAVKNLINLVTQFNLNNPDANLDVTLSPPMLYRAYLLYLDQAQFRRDVEKFRQTQSTVSAEPVSTSDVTVSVESVSTADATTTAEPVSTADATTTAEPVSTADATVNTIVQGTDSTIAPMSASQSGVTNYAQPSDGA